jgi:holo-[acyl-carrier protein] synthase
MAILGVGVDLVDVRRFETVSKRRGDALARRLFTRAERAVCRGRPRCAEHMAGRFAAKEAFLKALGTGYAKRIRWTDVEVSGLGRRVELRLHGQAKALCAERKVRRTHLSITHTDRHAAAFVILEGKEGAGRGSRARKRGRGARRARR